MKYVAMQRMTNPKTMQCAEAKGLLSPYLDGVLTGTEMQALQAHLEGCAGPPCGSTSCCSKRNSC